MRKRCLTPVTDYRYITITKGYVGGKPAFISKRIPLEQALKDLCEDTSVEHYCLEYGLEQQAVFEAIRFAQELSQNVADQDLIRDGRQIVSHARALCLDVASGVEGDTWSTPDKSKWTGDSKALRENLEAGARKYVGKIPVEEAVQNVGVALRQRLPRDPFEHLKEEGD